MPITACAPATFSNNSLVLLEVLVILQVLVRPFFSADRTYSTLALLQHVAGSFNKQCQ